MAGVPSVIYGFFGLLVLRLGLGLILIYYGSQKVFGAFGGRGFDTTLTIWNETRGIPVWLGVLAVFSEFAGSIGLTRPQMAGMLGAFGRRWANRVNGSLQRAKSRPDPTPRRLSQSAHDGRTSPAS